MVKNWVKAFRLRTLPLAASGIMVGSAVAYVDGCFQVSIFVLALVTTFLLQILSNLANDYGDYKNGIDNDERVGPKRTVQSGAISATTMKKAIYIFSLLSLVFGVLLLIVSFKGVSIRLVIYFLVGILGIVAALKYTIGKTNFGYRGLGDVVVFIFFGLVAVVGVYFLYSSTIDYLVLLPAISIGMLSSGVLNVNNLRDVANDTIGGKNTLIVKMGFAKGKIYHLFLIITSLALLVVFLLLKGAGIYALILILPSILLLLHTRTVLKTKEPKKLDTELKHLAITTFLLSLVSSCILVFY